MEALGNHFLIELNNCSPKCLENPEFVEEILHEAVKISGATEIGTIFHQFSPHGVSGVILIAESHFSIHTWPENNYAAVDLFTCDNSLKIQDVYQFLVSKFEASMSSIIEIKRGLNLTESK